MHAPCMRTNGFHTRTAKNPFLLDPKALLQRHYEPKSFWEEGSVLTFELVASRGQKY